MRAASLTLFALLLCTAGTPGQDSRKPKSPKSGDTIVVTGCLRGSTLESTSMSVSDDETPRPVGHVFQLKGKKDLLKELRDKYNGTVVVVTGILKSRLTDDNERGTQVGNTRIVVGAESSMRSGGPMPGGTQAVPVLEAKSFESSQASCRR